MQTSSVVLCSLLAATTALGQITPDNTLGNESSVVTPNVNVKGNLADLIEGGAIRESNLFHSFSDFNVGEMGRVYFANPAGIENILSRVTGTNVSNILGTLGVLGNANLFLINPNGIVFGPNSRLDLGGSFFGSTADSVLFEDGTVFSAKNPNEKPLLTINIPSGLQYGSNPGSITNQSSLFRVPNGQTLGLIGGEVTIPGAVLGALDGRIELGSVGSNGLVKLTPTNTSFVLDYSGVQAFQDISLSDFAFVTTSGENGGSIQVQGANVSLRDRSFVFARTNGSGSGGGIVVKASQLSLEGSSRITADVTGSGQGGDLTVNASEFVRVNGIFSALGAAVLRGATGNGGDVSITTGQFIVSDEAQVAASTFGEGDGGDLTVNAEETVQLIGTYADGQIRSGLFSQTEGTGKAGNVRISTGQLIVSDGAVVSASTFGEGDGGILTVDADEKVQLIGTSADGRIVSGLFSQTEGTGNGGELNITTGQLIVSDGARVSADTLGEGDGGNLTVDASSSVQLIGTSADGQSASGLFAQANRGSKGKAGDVSITTGQLIVSDQAQVSTSTVGQGNGGELSITTGQLIISDAALVSAATLGEGDGGNLTVDASSSVQLIGTSADGLFVSGLTTQTQGTGNAGELNITTGQLIISDGAVVSAGTRGEGNGGTLSVDADSTVQVIGTTASGQFPSRLFTETEGTGNAGELNITTGQLIISDGALVSTATRGEGHGGNLTVNADSTVQVIGTSASGQFPSALLTEANSIAKGNAGNLTITTGELIVEDGARVSTRSFKKDSSAGEVEINANSIFLNNEVIISAETAGGDKSNINLDARDIRLLDESKIRTDASNTTTGGNITIDTDILLGLGDSDITANAKQGRGGRVTINAQGIFGLEFRDRPTPGNDITSTSERGSSFNGPVTLNTSVDPTSGLIELPASLVDAEAILANDLCGFENNRIAGGSSFTITGKGGLPPTRLDPVINTDRTVGWRTRPGIASTRRQQLQQQANVRRPQPVPEKKVIIEAQGWVTAKDGTIILTAHPFKGTPVEQILPNLDCHSGRGKRE
ncbi:two-partner secretion domain-containing protein [Moorena bouillonii]|uniref:two-partner secretion domain-containing protein n=1 Tax=Moorena bouillonii TaxID=207920 RepID=UPI0013014E45|nr:filamentous hemagglutinin N-terminal domain-containing protein [Moorena bouillonii]